VGGNSGQWWVEISEAKALAKTTQALREGAPKIRQTLRNAEPKSAKKRKRKVQVQVPSVVSISTETPKLDDATEKLVLQTVKQDASSLPRYKSEQLLLPTTDYSVAIEQLHENVEKARRDAVNNIQPQPTSPVPTLVAPLTSNKAFKQMYGQQNPLAMPAVDPFAETPPLMAAPEPDHANHIPVLSLDSTRTTIQVDSGAPPPASKRKKLERVHSLALSDVDGEAFEQFVNPFADESNVLNTVNDMDVVKAHVPASVFQQWTKNTEDAPAAAVTDNNRSKIISIGGYLNRLLSFSSSNNENSGPPLFRLIDESVNGGDNEKSVIGVEGNDKSINGVGGNDYFFLDDVPDFDLDASKPETDTSTGNKNSTASLNRRTSFSFNRGLVNGRQ
jgi:hypothetical protein